MSGSPFREVEVELEVGRSALYGSTVPTTLLVNLSFSFLSHVSRHLIVAIDR